MWSHPVPLELGLYIICLYIYIGLGPYCGTVGQHQFVCGLATYKDGESVFTICYQATWDRLISVVIVLYQRKGGWPRGPSVFHQIDVMTEIT